MNYLKNTKCQNPSDMLDYLHNTKNTEEKN